MKIENYCHSQQSEESVFYIAKNAPEHYAPALAILNYTSGDGATAACRRLTSRATARAAKPASSFPATIGRA